ncbi:MAG: hypothetical protein ACT4P4_03510 [Betaproteobacteria bacterium]
MLSSNARRDHHAFILFVFVLAAMLLAPLPALSRLAVAAKNQVPTFERADLNSDGYIDILEAKHFPAVRAGFGRADSNGDNRVDKVEFARAF